ncbi:intermembrane transport protein PqiB [Pelagibaculum spongiae]|uniref:Paraquat-inducible protein B n=1 Tax=Pelagibaculum spongiae TaxID=2080658 RepID=A0A2V1H012_9GAMM|nr:intermembrane transport protein PqiB [Pelagibaculum spongiae]PVZ70534.1 paraquat-inducible protein B [Pelagibaculum spongiae]
MSEITATAAIKQGRRFSAIWILPLVSIVIGIWMVGYHLSSQGPTVEVTFASAEGLEAGKTYVKYRNVNVGQVKQVKLNSTFDGVNVIIQMEPETEALLRRGSDFWVVRPRIDAGGISGFGTLLSGAYIEVSPGSGAFGETKYPGLENPPITAPGVPGIRITLKSLKADTLGIGDPVLYHGYQVGQIETAGFDIDKQKAVYQLFISAPYNQLVTSNSRFWNASGISFNASTEGISFRTGSLQTLLQGGVAFDLPEGEAKGDPIAMGREYHLYPDFESIHDRQYQQKLEYVLLFDESVRGLSAGAPVEYRGVRVGTVKRIALELSARSAMSMVEQTQAIPVLITIEPGRLGEGDTAKVAEAYAKEITKSVGMGLRASLKSGNLLTGSLFVEVNYHSNAKPAHISNYQGYMALPTVKSGLERLGDQLDGMISRMDQLKLEETLSSIEVAMNSAGSSMDQFKVTMMYAERFMDSKEFKALPDSLDKTITSLQKLLNDYSADGQLYNELETTMNQLKGLMWQLQPLMQSLQEKPNAIIFGKDRKADPLLLQEQ